MADYIIFDSILDEQNSSIPDEVLVPNEIPLKEAYNQLTSFWTFPLLTTHQESSSHIYEHRNPFVYNKGKIRDDWRHQQQGKQNSPLLQESTTKHQRTKTFAQPNLISSSLYGTQKNSNLAFKEPYKTSQNSSVNICNNSTSNVQISKNQGVIIDASMKDSSKILLQQNQIQTFDFQSKTENVNSQSLNDSPGNIKQRYQSINYDKQNQLRLKGQSNASLEQSKNQQISPEKKCIQNRTKISNFFVQLINRMITPDMSLKDQTLEMDEKQMGLKMDDYVIIEESENAPQSRNGGENPLKKSKTFHPCPEEDEEQIMEKISNFRMLTQKQIIISDENQIDLDTPSKSYVYLAKGLSEEIKQDDFEKYVNYTSAFFENDQDLELYYKQLKEALNVQFQKEINISHDQVKHQYDEWVKSFQIRFEKKSPHKKTLVFDLDETLIRAQKDDPKNGYDGRITVIDQASDENYYIYVKLRPFLMETLARLQKHYELILFTAASDQYADIVLQTFDGQNFFDHILSRKQCLFIYEHNVYVKDLTILLNGRSLKDIVIVDNKIESYSSNLENGIPISSYIGQDDDQMLQILTPYLLQLRSKDDVRDKIKKDFYLQEIADFDRSDNQVFDSEKIKDCIVRARNTHYLEKALEQIGKQQ